MSESSQTELQTLERRQKDAFFQNLKQLFASDKYSDLEVHSPSGKLKAHKIVLAAGSEYLKTCLEHTVAESKSGASFNEKDFKALKGCLAHLYGIHFDTRADCIDSENSNGYISSDVELAKYQVRLHAMAEKYKMQDLSERTRIVLAGLAKELLHQNAEAFLEVVKYIWTANKIHDKSLRRAVADVLVADYVEHEEFEKLVKVNSNIPGLEPDLRLARQIRLAPDMLNASEDSSQTRQSRKAPSRVVVYDEGYDR